MEEKQTDSGEEPKSAARIASDLVHRLFDWGDPQSPIHTSGVTVDVFPTGDHSKTKRFIIESHAAKMKREPYDPAAWEVR